MSSKYKTDDSNINSSLRREDNELNLGLNKWIGTDKPVMDDFNTDNDLIYLAIKKNRDLIDALTFNTNTELDIIKRNMTTSDNTFTSILTKLGLTSDVLSSDTNYSIPGISNAINALRGVDEIYDGKISGLNGKITTNENDINDLKRINVVKSLTYTTSNGKLTLKTGELASNESTTTEINLPLCESYNATTLPNTAVLMSKSNVESIATNKINDIIANNTPATDDSKSTWSKNNIIDIINGKVSPENSTDDTKQLLSINDINNNINTALGNYVPSEHIPNLTIDSEIIKYGLINLNTIKSLVAGAKMSGSEIVQSLKTGYTDGKKLLDALNYDTKFVDGILSNANFTSKATEAAFSSDIYKLKVQSELAPDGNNVLPNTTLTPNTYGSISFDTLDKYIMHWLTNSDYITNTNFKNSYSVFRSANKNRLALWGESELDAKISTSVTTNINNATGNLPTRADVSSMISEAVKELSVDTPNVKGILDYTTLSNIISNHIQNNRASVNEISDNLDTANKDEKGIVSIKQIENIIANHQKDVDDNLPNLLANRPLTDEAVHDRITKLSGSYNVYGTDIPTRIQAIYGNINSRDLNSEEVRNDLRKMLSNEWFVGLLKQHTPFSFSKLTELTTDETNTIPFFFNSEPLIEYNINNEENILLAHKDLVSNIDLSKTLWMKSIIPFRNKFKNYTKAILNYAQLSKVYISSILDQKGMVSTYGLNYLEELVKDGGLNILQFIMKSNKSPELFDNIYKANNEVIVKEHRVFSNDIDHIKPYTNEELISKVMDDINSYKLFNSTEKPLTWLRHPYLWLSTNPEINSNNLIHHDYMKDVFKRAVNIGSISNIKEKTGVSMTTFTKLINDLNNHVKVGNERISDVIISGFRNVPVDILQNNTAWLSLYSNMKYLANKTVVDVFDKMCRINTTGAKVRDVPEIINNIPYMYLSPKNSFGINKLIDNINSATDITEEELNNGLSTSGDKLFELIRNHDPVVKYILSFKETYEAKYLELNKPSMRKYKYDANYNFNNINKYGNKIYKATYGFNNIKTVGMVDDDMIKEMRSYDYRNLPDNNIFMRGMGISLEESQVYMDALLDYNGLIPYYFDVINDTTGVYAAIKSDNIMMKAIEMISPFMYITNMRKYVKNTGYRDSDFDFVRPKRIFDDYIVRKSNLSWLDVFSKVIIPHDFDNVYLQPERKYTSSQYSISTVNKPEGALPEIYDWIPKHTVSIPFNTYIDPAYIYKPYATVQGYWSSDQVKYLDNENNLFRLNDPDSIYYKYADGFKQPESILLYMLNGTFMLSKNEYEAYKKYNIPLLTNRSGVLFYNYDSMENYLLSITPKDKTYDNNKQWMLYTYNDKLLACPPYNISSLTSVTKNPSVRDDNSRYYYYNSAFYHPTFIFMTRIQTPTELKMYYKPEYNNNKKTWELEVYNTYIAPGILEYREYLLACLREGVAAVTDELINTFVNNVHICDKIPYINKDKLVKFNKGLFVNNASAEPIITDDLIKSLNAIYKKINIAAGLGE